VTPRHHAWRDERSPERTNWLQTRNIARTRSK
jgi:hypothetical protein